jgi:hypothetical protein
MTAKTPLRLWWKVERPKTRVLRLVHRHEGTHLQHYWVAVGELPTQEPPTAQEMETLREAGALSAYEGYERDYEATKRREQGIRRLPITYDEWEVKVREAHRDLVGHFGAERLAVVLPASDPTIVHLFLSSANSLPLFTLLSCITHTTVAQHLLKGLGLPFTCYPYLLHQAELTGGVRTLKFLFPDPEEPQEEDDEEPQEDDEDEGMTAKRERERTLFGGRAPDKVAYAFIPYMVIDPRSGKPIQVDDYLKGHFVNYIMISMQPEIHDDVTHLWSPRFTKLNAQFLSGSGLPLPSYEWADVIDWLRERPQALKAILSYIMPTGDRNLALLGIYTIFQAMKDYTRFIRQQPDLDALTATQIMDYLKGRVEYWAEEGKGYFGLKDVPVTAERVWVAGWEALRKFRQMELADVDEVAPDITLHRLVTLEAWETDPDEATKTLTAITPVLTNEELNDPEVATRMRQLRAMMKTAHLWSRVLMDTGEAYISENRRTLRERFSTLNFYDLDLYQDLANKAVARFHNELSHVVRAIRKTESLIPAVEQLGRGGVVAVVDFSPLGFYTLTKDDTCYSRGNYHHPFILGLMPNSAVVRFFAQGRDLGRLWGFLHLKDGAIYLTNRVGALNKTTLSGWGLAVAATLLGTTPDKIKVETAKISQEFDDLLYRKLAQVRSAVDADIYDRPYTNGDEFKVLV